MQFRPHLFESDQRREETFPGDLEQLGEELSQQANRLAETYPSPYCDRLKAPPVRSRWPLLSWGSAAAVLLIAVGSSFAVFSGNDDETETAPYAKDSSSLVQKTNLDLTNDSANNGGLTDQISLSKKFSEPASQLFNIPPTLDQELSLSGHYSASGNDLLFDFMEHHFEGNVENEDLFNYCDDLHQELNLRDQQIESLREKIEQLEKNRPIAPRPPAVP